MIKGYLLKQPKRNPRPRGERHQRSAEKAQDGRNVCVPKCHKLALFVVIYLASAWLWHQWLCSLGRARFHSLMFSSIPRVAHSQGEAQTDCKATPKSWHSLLGTVPSWLGNLDNQRDKCKLPGKDSLTQEKVQTWAWSIYLERGHFSSNSVFCLFVCFTCSDWINVFVST